MKGKQRTVLSVAAACAMGILILDAKTALLGGAEGVALCIQTLIPSLLPFFLISNLLTASLMGQDLRLLRPVGRLLRIPKGSEVLMLVGLLGGYPTGAQAVAQARQKGRLSRADAGRMLAFCSNAGPAFIFGVGARVFPELWMCWALWAVHIISAFAVGIMTPAAASSPAFSQEGTATSLPAALKRSVETMGLVCGWVVIFRVVLAFLDRWLLWLFPMELQVTLSGLLELANGCCYLTEIEPLGLRLLLGSLFLSFGGLCVTLQTASVAGSVDTGLYLPGKITQAAVSTLLCIPLQLLLTRAQRWDFSVWIPCAAAFVCMSYYVFARKMKNNSSISAAAVV